MWKNFNCEKFSDTLLSQKKGLGHLVLNEYSPKFLNIPRLWLLMNMIILIGMHLYRCGMSHLPIYLFFFRSTVGTRETNVENIVNPCTTEYVPHFEEENVDCELDIAELDMQQKSGIPDLAPKREKKVHKQKFRAEWMQRFKWLQTKSGNSQCVVCDRNITGGITHLKRHERCGVHLKRLRSASNTPKVETYISNEPKEKNFQLVKEAELKLTMFLNEHNLPFQLMDHLPDFIRSICPDSNIAKLIKCGRTKATAITRDCLAKEQISIIVEKLKSNVYSLIIDETTDVSTHKALAVVVRFYDKPWADEFLGMIRVKSSSADDLFTEIIKLLTELDIPLKNMIGFAADNTNVMMGNISGVQAKFRELLPNIFILGCVCHSFHLCASAATKKLPRNLEDFIRNIYNYFAHSSKRCEALQEFQLFLDLKPHKLLHPSQTRWLSLEVKY